ncbi:unnamed protein product [Brassicogethes aeneus]|uniref:Diacylglycerol kinase n=1 Tax=Brassicogethes aeneus TaxID=1431903 RepID=A0A9P0FIY4_BRAAE|nr:unnamed protein product [Brassicogethes aeneus]
MKSSSLPTNTLQDAGLYAERSSFQSKLLRSKDIVAISCSWCKVSYHNKECCFDTDLIGEECKMGVHAGIIVPPSWIIKLPERGNFKSSLRKTSKKRRSKKKGREKDIEMALLSFIIKPIPTMFIIPIIIFINPKSGGNQGLMLTHKFQWLLNPRQVFDLTVGGPNLGLELYKRVPNLRVLACGGDGTVGWVLDVIDKIDIHPRPPGYTDEPISKILSHLSLSETISLDRWQLEVTPNDAGDKSDPAKENLPLNVVNNYFSLGVDAHIALEFHEAREAHPEKFNSRLRNKVFYGQMGGKDLLKRKWRDLSDHVTLECDGRDLTPKLKELKVHAIVFLNIPRSMGSHEQSTEDGYIEVVGLTTYQLPLLQAGGHGSAIAQCQTATLVTDKTIPMQVDGEACKLNPSVIKLSLLNKAPMLAKKKGKGVVHHAEIADLTINLHRLNIADYKAYHYEKNLLIDSAIKMGAFDINPTNDLEYVRSLINKFVDGLNDDEKISPDWCFVDSITAERFFRVDKAQENLHYITDICSDDLYILECADELQLLEDTTAVPSPSSAEKVPYNIPEMRVSYEGSLDSPSDYPTVSSSSTKSEEPSTSKTTQNGYSLSRDKQAEAMLNAAKVGDSTLIKLLHGQGCSLTSKDPAGQTVLHYAVRYGHMEIVKYILIYASDSVDVQETHLGQTALHKAVAYKWKELCGVLVAAGASLTIQDKKGLTPKMLAVHIGDPGIIAYLESQESFQKAYVQPGTNV